MLPGRVENGESCEGERETVTQIIHEGRGVRPLYLHSESPC